MIFKGNNLLKIEDLLKSNENNCLNENLSNISSCGKIESCKWYKTQNGCHFKDILILTVCDEEENRIEVHVDNQYVEELVKSLKESDNILDNNFNLSNKHFNDKKIFFEGEIIYFNNKNICIYKNGSVYKHSA